MRIATLSLLLVLTIFAVSALASDSVKGTILHPNGRFEYTRIDIVDTAYDGFMTYWVGETARNNKAYLYDPYNKLWVESPVRYVEAVLPFGNSKIDGIVRVFGDGTSDKRFFFGNNGHTYWRFDKYRLREGQNNRKKKYHVYSFWLDLDTGYRGPAYKYINGELYYVDESRENPAWNKELSSTFLEPAPTPEELDADAKNAMAEEAFPNLQSTEANPPVIDEKPLSDEEKTSLGSLIDETLNANDTTEK